MRLTESVSFWILIFSLFIGCLIGSFTHWIVGTIIFLLLAGKSAIYGLVMDTISGSLEYHHDREDMRAKKKMESLAYLKYGIHGKNSKSNPMAFEADTSFMDESKTQGKIYKIVEIGPGGGWVFYDKGFYSDGWRYLEAAPIDQTDRAEWGCLKKSIRGAKGTAVGTGKSNTQAIIKSCSEDSIAAKICTEYRGGGKNDWFLPSKEELNLMCNSVVDDSTYSVYWSSSEATADMAWFQQLGSSIQSRHNKDFAFNVRAIRSF